MLRDARDAEETPREGGCAILTLGALGGKTVVEELGVEEVLGLLSQASRVLDELDLSAFAPDAGSRAGPGASAAENRAISAAQAAMARQRATAVRAELQIIRVRAQAMREKLLHSSGAAARQTSARHSFPPALEAGIQNRPADSTGRYRPADGPAPEGPTPQDTTGRHTQDARFVARHVRAVARGLMHVETTEDIFRLITRALLSCMPKPALTGVCHSPTDNKAPTVIAGDAELLELLSLEQAEGGGPCIEAMAGHPALYAVDLLAENGRWPQLAFWARERNLGPVLAHRLIRHDHDSLAVLIAVGRAGTDLFQESSLTISCLADLAAVALSGSRRNQALNQVVSTQRSIGRAEGILMSREALDEHQAGDLLAWSADRDSITLAGAAARVLQQPSHMSWGA